MRKLFVAVVIAAMATTGFTVLATADEGQDGTEWTFSFGTEKTARATTSSSLIKPAKVDDNGTPEDESDDVFTPPSKTTINFTKGSSINTAALARCKFDASDVGGGEQCPNKTRVGSGAAKSRLGGEAVGNDGKRRGGTEINATIDAFNKKKSILFVIQPCGVGTGPSTGTDCQLGLDPIVLEGQWKNVDKAPKLIVKTPKSLLQGGVVITEFALDTKKKTKKKTVKIDGEKQQVVLSFATSPSKCKNNKWKSSALENYVDGSKQTIKDSQTCDA
ncbi:MAG TPA: hypothetical protein VD790_01740 [Thermoleophilaceae bacterium]|nr:hypothetical protein [Thermoleophilaceae bacterium]